MSEPRDFNEEFEDIIDDPNQNPIRFYDEDDVQDLGPAIATGSTDEELAEALEIYLSYLRLLEKYE